MMRWIGAVLVACVVALSGASARQEYHYSWYDESYGWRDAWTPFYTDQPCEGLFTNPPLWDAGTTVDWDGRSGYCLPGGLTNGARKRVPTGAMQSTIEILD